MKAFFLTAIVFVLTLATAGGAFAQQPSLEGTMEARKIVVDKDEKEIAIPAERVVPRDIVEYMLRYRNTGDVVARGVELVGPIPEGTVYVDESASKGEAMKPLFSIDGGETYQEAPVYYVLKKGKDREERRKATPDMITHIKWTMKEALKKSEIIETSYRVRVK